MNIQQALAKVVEQIDLSIADTQENDSHLTSVNKFFFI